MPVQGKRRAMNLGQEFNQDRGQISIHVSSVEQLLPPVLSQVDNMWFTCDFLPCKSHVLESAALLLAALFLLCQILSSPGEIELGWFTSELPKNHICTWTKYFCLLLRLKKQRISSSENKKYSSLETLKSLWWRADWQAKPVWMH